MPSRFVLQPNGLLARFSTIVDHFTHYNLTKEEAIEVAREDMGRKDAEEKVERGLKDEIYWHDGTYGDGTWRWKHDIASVEAVHGKEEREKTEALLSAPPEPDPKDPPKPRTAWERLGDEPDP
jgi:hypothetical protein